MIVVVYSFESFADPINAQPLLLATGGINAPVSHGSVPSATANALKGKKATEVVVVGGTAAVSDAVVAQVQAITGGTIRRLSGQDRYQTAALVSAFLGSGIITSPPVTPPSGTGTFVWPVPGGVAIHPGDNWATISAANPNGTIFNVYPGTHHSVSFTPKLNQQFIGPRTALTGGTLKSIYGVNYLVGLIETPTAILDGDNTVVNAFWGANVNGVVIKNLKLTNYKFAQQAAVIDFCGNGGRTASGWYLENVWCDHNGYGGFNIGDSSTANHCRSSYNAYIGYAASFSDSATYEYCEFDHNHTAADDPWVEASGGKTAESTYFTMRYSWSHDHDTVGMWTDINNYMTQYIACLVERAGYAGIMHEISYNWTCHDCEITGCTGSDGWNNAILISASGSVNGEADSEIYHNLIDGNWGGIMEVEQNRGTGSRGAYQVKNNYIHHNAIKHTTYSSGGWQDHSDTSIFNTRNNRWDYNDWVSHPSFGRKWDDSDLSYAGWQATGNDAHGTNT